MKRLILVIWSAFLFNACFSQKKELFVVAAGGGTSESENINFQWTLGELAIETIHSDVALFTQGFNQPTIIVGNANNNKPTDSITNISNHIKVMPNPVHDELK